MKVEPIALNAEVRALLVDAGLPVSDLDEAREVQLFATRQYGELVGVVGLEMYGSDGMLRSLVVTGTARAEGVGQALVAHAEAFALRQGITELFLLTISAERFFAKLGYVVVPRSTAPAAIAQTEQFMGLCPSSSSFMHKRLQAP
ncbi:arsenic resistance N-acetyltransferase ArsN2 [Kineobactrum salinum]|uniref:GNAT family N-acetyltransferase n=1 Tax=Kineobactrum salinum TaxID=2708301 RepID=A0A6C0U4G3_9GAMM|nr:arsenic resistance N-acetyltransferase ArsN2 [Kineobactrum salinum]QIB66733.1 GNAT family N-acetyltransferase [Kineobactrum salinum]